MTFLTPKIVINTPIVITRVMDTFTDTYIYIQVSMVYIGNVRK